MVDSYRTANPESTKGDHRETSISLTFLLYHKLRIRQANINELIDGVQIRYIPIIAMKAA